VHTRRLFTVFTPTYNRSALLARAYESLCKQTLKDFEWLVVDDGSTDETPDLLKQWHAEGRIEIRFFRQSNKGKHVAFNRAVALAAGEFFLPLDSDDICMENALERLYAHWLSIAPERREQFSGVTCLCRTPEGEIIGAPFPADRLESNPIVMLRRRALIGDKWGFHRTSVLREFPFPEIAGERFMPEGLVWYRIAARYNMLYVNEPLRIVTYYADGLSAAGLKLRVSSPVGLSMFYLELAARDIGFIQRLRAMVNYVRYARHAGRSAQAMLAESGSKGLLMLAMLPGVGIQILDVIRQR
jgi:glycosyltransferase involved in cell wall biosynthesis